MSRRARCLTVHTERSAPEVELRPSGPRWIEWITDRWTTHGASAESARFREQLGLPTDTPLVMTGHQPTLWHAGILAKYFAADSAASGADGHPVWLVADQDAVDPFELRIPVMDRNRGLRTEKLRLGPNPPSGVAASTLPAAQISTITIPDGAPDPVRSGAERLISALRAHEAAPNAAAQAAHAIADLLRDLGLHGALLFATRLAATDLFAIFLERLRNDPAGSALAYNMAAANRPHAGVGPLELDEIHNRVELPLWRIRPGARRERVFAQDLGSIPACELAPRALMMTAILRLAGCELFIHGSGGAEYDLVTEDWLRAWLGQELAPSALATATLRLPLECETPSNTDVDRAVWVAHHARHDPSVLGLNELASQKRAYVERIHDLQERGVDPAPEFQRMQRFLRDCRARHSSEITELDRQAEILARNAGQREIADDRTWAFSLHGRESLDALRAEIQARFE